MKLVESNNNRNRHGWSKGSLKYLDKVRETLEGLTDYWPLTLRQVYYSLVSSLIIPNVLSEYQKLSRLLSKARLDNLVSWDAIEDRARSRLISGGWHDITHFTMDEMGEFLQGYRRDLLQSQDHAIEIWIEKDALSRICHKVALPYCIPVTVARGFSSVSYVHECRTRIEKNAEEGRRTIILYFGDLDPSGWEMLPAMLETLQVDMKLGDKVEGYRCALNPEQVDLYNLPHSIDAIKPKDTRTKKYKKMFGTLAVELDALPPAIFEDIIRQSIEEKLNLIKFHKEKERESEERDRLEEMRDKIDSFLRESLI